MNRLTITLDDELYAMAHAHAVKRRTSISMAIRDLLRRATSLGPPPHQSRTEPSFTIDPVTLLPVVPSDGRKITLDVIQQASDDEDLRHLEMMGLGREAIERALSK